MDRDLNDVLSRLQTFDRRQNTQRSRKGRLFAKKPSGERLSFVGSMDSNPRRIG
jgi:hypothetical protein